MPYEPAGQGYRTTAAITDRKTAAVATCLTEFLVHHRAACYNESDAWLLDYGLVAEKPRWVAWGPDGALAHTKVGRWSANAWTHHADATMTALLVAYPAIGPVLLCAQPKLVNVKGAGGEANADQFTITGTLVGGEAESFDLTLPPGDSDVIFLGGPKLRIEKMASPYRNSRWYTDVPTIARKLDSQGNPIPGSGASVQFDVVWDDPATLRMNGVPVANQAATYQSIQVGPPYRHPCLCEDRFGVFFLAYVRDAGGIGIKRLYSTAATAWDTETVGIEAAGADWPWIVKTRDDLLVCAYQIGDATEVATSKLSGKGGWTKTGAVPNLSMPVLVDDWSGRQWIMGVRDGKPCLVRSTDYFATLDTWPVGGTAKVLGATLTDGPPGFLKWDSCGRIMQAYVRVAAGVEVWESKDNGDTWAKVQTRTELNDLTYLVAAEEDFRFWLAGYAGGNTKLARSIDDWATVGAFQSAASRVTLGASDQDRVGFLKADCQGRVLLAVTSSAGAMTLRWSKDDGSTWETLVAAS